MANLNLNKVILGGRITNELELKQTPSGVCVCSFSIAVARKVGKDKEQQTDFINCVAWRNTAEFIQRYFRKGSSIAIVGNIQTRSWDDKNGGKRYATEVIVDEAMFVDSKSDAGNHDAPAFSAQPTTAPNFEELKTDDDLPF